jgi:hypothetical protein
MKTFQVIFKKRVNRKKSVLVERASGHRINGMMLEFFDETGAVIAQFPILNVREFPIFADDDDTMFSASP